MWITKIQLSVTGVSKTIRGMKHFFSLLKNCVEILFISDHKNDFSDCFMKFNLGLSERKKIKMHKFKWPDPLVSNLTFF